MRCPSWSKEYTLVALLTFLEKIPGLKVLLDLYRRRSLPPVLSLNDLLAWVVMPNHVHVVVKSIRSLPEIMRWLKAATANRANSLLGRTGEAFWQREYFDRWIRTEKQLGSVIAYVEDNPVRSGLAACPEEWRWSSAYKAPAAGSPALPGPSARPPA